MFSKAGKVFRGEVKSMQEGGGNLDAQISPEPSLTVLIEPSKKEEPYALHPERFHPPTQHEVISYMGEQGFRTPADTAAKFINYYEMLGWIPKGSKTQMKSWKAAVRTWKTHEKPHSAHQESPEHLRRMKEIERGAAQHDLR
jgi:hypothetical protein